ncbi:MAG: hypothetical protein AB7Q16_24580 [Vicinamibacterales bacterium]
MPTTGYRLLAAAAILACLPIGQLVAAERSIAAMTTAATRFLASRWPTTWRPTARRR